MTVDQKFLATVGYLFAAAVVYRVAALAGVLMVVGLLVLAHMVVNEDGPG